MEFIETITKEIERLSKEEAQDIIKNVGCFIIEHEEDYNKENSTKESKQTSVGFAITGGHLFSLIHHKSKRFDLYEKKGPTEEELRKGYREITGLDNDQDFTAEEVHAYLLDALKE